MGLSPYEFDITPEEYSSALNTLDFLMAEWAVSSLDLGYAFPATLGGGDLEDVSGIPDFSVNAASLSLAQRQAPARLVLRLAVRRVLGVLALTRLRVARRVQQPPAA